MRETTTINLETNPIHEVHRLRHLGECWIQHRTWTTDSDGGGVGEILGRVFRFCIDGDGLFGLLVETQRSEHGGSGMVFLRFSDIVRISFDPANVLPMPTPSDHRRIRKIRRAARSN